MGDLLPATFKKVRTVGYGNPVCVYHTLIKLWKQRRSKEEMKVLPLTGPDTVEAACRHSSLTPPSTPGISLALE